MTQTNTITALKVERFHDGDDQEYRIHSSIGILHILRDIARQEEPVALFYNNDQDFILTQLLEVDEDGEGIWLDISNATEKNEQLLDSEKVTFVSMHQRIKIQFPVSDIGIYPHEGGKAFYVDMPEYILRVLRREFFRIPIPPETPVKCIIPTRPKTSDKPMSMYEVPVAEISGDGLGLTCDEHDDTLQPGKSFRDCQIVIPDFGTLKATIRVRTSSNFTTPDGVVRKRIGCQLVFLDNRMSVLLQRYIIHLQGIREREPLMLLPPGQEPEADATPED